MPNYTVILTATATYTVHVDADTAQAAAEQAIDDGVSGLCHQCSGYAQRFELHLSDEWSVETVIDPGGNEVAVEV